MKRQSSLPLLMLVALVMISSTSIATISVVTAQTRSSRMPKQDYYVAFGEYYRGDYKDAQRRFRSAYNSAFRVGNNRFVDSVCILTMLGECHYQVGDYATAMNFYNQSAELYLKWAGRRWQGDIQLPRAIPASTSAVQRARVTWGTPKRQGRIANIPDTLSVTRGQTDAPRILVGDSILDTTEIRAVDVTEVMRCVALMIRRRGSILGPSAKYDPLSIQIAAKLKRNGMGNGSYLGSLNGIVYGCVISSFGQKDKAVELLTRSLQLAGGLDHPLTSLGLIELAEIELLKENSTKAVALATEASFTAAYFAQYDWIEEALSIGTQAHLLTQRTLFPPLRNAVVWAGRENADKMQAALSVRMAECFSESGDAAASGNVLKEVSRMLSRRNSLGKTIIASRAKYLTALNLFLAGNNQQGLKQLQDAISHLGTRSKLQYRLRTADAVNSQGGLTEKQADALYTLTLQDPSDLQWKLDPMEAIAFLLTPHVDAMQRWFTVVVNRKRNVQALEIADAIRRHRFYSTLPMGGRLLSLRWVLHGDVTLLSQNALQQRQKFLARYSDYRKLLNDAATVRAKLDDLEVFPDKDSPDFSERKKQVSELVKISNAQEAMLASFALRREPADLAFPPRVNPERIEASMEAGQLALITLQTGEGYHIFMIDPQRTRYFGLVSESAVKHGLTRILNSLGASKNFASTDVLTTDQWKEVVAEFQTNLLEDVDITQIATTKELIVIPDGLFWYLPWESFFMNLEAQETTFGDAMSIRYCPTLSLAFAKPRAVKRSGQTGLVAGVMYAKTDNVATTSFVDQFVIDVPDAVAVPEKVIFPSNHSVFQLDQLVTLQAEKPRGKPYDIKPLAVDTARFGTTLFDWMLLPEWAPETMVLPGLNSVGAGASKADGSDMFLTTTALLASGSRAALVSRWNSGGQMQIELAGRFAKCSRNMSLGDALKTSIEEVKLLDVDYAKEPRIDVEKNAAPITGASPFFWANQILVALPEPPIAARVASNDPADGAKSNGSAGKDKVDITLPSETLPAGLSVKEKNPSEKIDPAPEKLNVETEMGSPDEDEEEDEVDDDEGAVWSIGGEK